MYKASEKIFFKMLLSGRVVETHIYCEDDFVYNWESYNIHTDKLEYYYLISPRTRLNYEKFVEWVGKEYPLLMELV